MTSAVNTFSPVAARYNVAPRPAAQPARAGSPRGKHFREPAAAPAAQPRKAASAPAPAKVQAPAPARPQARAAAQAVAAPLTNVLRPGAARPKAATLPRPTSQQLRTELTRERRVRRTIVVAKSTVYALVVVAAVAVLAATLFLPVFRIYGTSMNPTFTEGDVVVAVRGSDLAPGDPVVFYYENKVLVKRFIANAGQWVNIDQDGVVYVDGERLDEPYVAELALGECNIELPYQVPEGRIFVLGDNRATSVDSRSTSVGCVSEEQLVGKIVFRVWPLSDLGTVE